MGAPQTCDNCGERIRYGECACGDYRPEEVLFDDPEDEE